jgi:hypothetical protein
VCAHRKLLCANTPRALSTSPAAVDILDHDRVEPTDNAAECALRHPVIWRQLSFGTQSNQGSPLIETMLTVIDTCHQQRRNVFTFLTDVMQAHFANQPTP